MLGQALGLNHVQNHGNDTFSIHDTISNALAVILNDQVWVDE